jgi:multiple sugar transport system ATP-binding protein
MRAGIIQQVDSPKVLYEDPANLFVAGFIGSPAMNFVPGRIEGDKLKLPFGETTLSPEIRQKLQSHGGGGGGAREVIAGVRPEHFEDAAVDDPNAPHRLKFRAKVDVVESMGSELYAYFEVAGAADVKSDQLQELAADAGMEDLPSSGAQIVARLDAASSARADHELEMSLDCSQIKLFEPNGGKSLLVAG